MKLKVMIKCVYGNILTYPACEDSQLLARLARKKTFDPEDLGILQELGYEIELVSGYELPKAKAASK